MIRPESQHDGPFDVHLVDEEHARRYDRVRHTQSGMVTLYDVHVTENEHAGNTYSKGNRAVTIPRERIEQIDWLGYGDD